MDISQLMKTNTPYCAKHGQIKPELQLRAKELVWEYNQTRPSEAQKRHAILKQLLGTCHELTFIEPSFRCDYGFNIHSYGLAVINYNCVMLDTSPIHIGAGAFIGPGTCLSCAGHSLDEKQRVEEGIGTSAPIILDFSSRYRPKMSRKQRILLRLCGKAISLSCRWVLASE